MALKTSRWDTFLYTDNFMNVTGEAGSVLVFDTSTSGVGASLDDTNAKVKLPVVAGGSGEVFAGFLMGDVVNKDLTRTHLNVHKRETQVGGKVGRQMDGFVVTDRVAPGRNPDVGNACYFTIHGKVTDEVVNAGVTKIGTFGSAKDSDGFVKVYLS